ncbi:MAG: RNA polymerase factor sigma-54 [Chthonomonadaceae bacterium]|nr:RNA polymerase factor sigma-54 [Chthonomonadaceae bacterium]
MVRYAEVSTVLMYQEQKQSANQRIDPKIIMANNILQLNSIELHHTIEDELLDNPALEAVEEGHCDGKCVDAHNCPYCSARLKQREESDDTPHDLYDSGDPETDYEPYFGAFSLEPDEEYDPLGNLEAELTLAEHLRGLLRAGIDASDYWIGEYIIHTLDDKGWLGETVEATALELDVETEDVLRVLTVIQSFDPPGVAARGLQECLLLQIRFLKEEAQTPAIEQYNALAERAIRDFFEHFGARRYLKLARSLGCTAEEAKQTLEYIRAHLNPRPAAQFRPPWSYRPANAKSTIRPDVFIRRNEHGYEIEVIGGEPYGLGLNPMFRDAYSQIKAGSGSHTEDERRIITEYVERAELFIRNINQRRQTLKQITRMIIDFQTGFIETGSRQFLRPLTRTRIAKMLSIHESTVSRATANKFVQLPNQEVVNFNLFFNSSLSTKDIIEEIILDEDPTSPYSDQQIVDKLKERGVTVARRTVVKYREQEKILSSTRRRR